MVSRNNKYNHVKLHHTGKVALKEANIVDVSGSKTVRSRYFSIDNNLLSKMLFEWFLSPVYQLLRVFLIATYAYSTFGFC